MQQTAYQTEIRDRRKVVVLSEKEWKRFQSDHAKLKKKLEILLGIQASVREVKEVQSGRRNPKSFKAFLDEL